MTRAVTWVLVRGDNAIRLIVLGRVLVVTELDVPNPTALARQYDTAAEAYAGAVRRTRSEEDKGFILSGPVRQIDTDLNPRTVAWAYAGEYQLADGLRGLLARLDQGQGVPL